MEEPAPTPGRQAASGGARAHPGEPPATHDAGKEEPPRRFADSFSLVFLFLLAYIFASAVAGDSTYGRIAPTVILAATAWLALRASGVKRRLLRLAMALIPLATLVAVLATLLGDPQTAQKVVAPIGALLIVVAPLAMVRRLWQHMTISLETFFGAVSIYLLIAMLFATLFALTGNLYDEPFFVQLTTAETQQFDYQYFSFVTITTTGYGDLTAGIDAGKALAVFEAILGQLYLITVVAVVVQNLGRERQMRPRRR